MSKLKPLMAYLGPPGSFSELAFDKFFNNQYAKLEVASYEELFEAVVEQKCALSLVPFENSQEGAIKSNVKLLMDYDLKIDREIFLPIAQNFLANTTDLKKIKKIYSHPQAFLQCDKWIKTNLPQAQRIETLTTSKAALLAFGNKNSAAIGSVRAAKLHKLNVIFTDIADSPTNTTRFVVVKQALTVNKTDDKFFIYVVLQDKVGALLELLQVFYKYNINLTEIESRPHKEKMWNYGFFIGAMGNVNSYNVKQALKEIGKFCLSYKLYGSLKESHFSMEDIKFFYDKISTHFRNNLNYLNFNLRSDDTYVNHILALLRTRFSIVGSIGIAKLENHTKITDSEREKMISEKRQKKYSKHQALSQELLAFFSAVMSVSKKIQREVQEKFNKKIITKNDFTVYSLDELRSFIDIVDKLTDLELAKLPNKTLQNTLQVLIAKLKSLDSDFIHK